jgi:hypothetical protein
LEKEFVNDLADVSRSNDREVNSRYGSSQGIPQSRR